MLQPFHGGLTLTNAKSRRAVIKPHFVRTGRHPKRLRELPDAERVRLLVEVSLLDALKESSRAG